MSPELVKEAMLKGMEISLNDYDKIFLFYPWNHQNEVIEKFMKYYTKNYINYIKNI